MINTYKKKAFKRTKTSILLLSFGLLVSCSSSRLVLTPLKTVDFCTIQPQLEHIIRQDQELLRHLFLENTSPQIYYDTLMFKGVLRYFLWEAATRMSKDKTLSPDSAYQQLELQTIQQYRERYQPTCLKNEVVYARANAWVRCWYVEEEQWLMVDVSTILREPGYRQGYAYFFQLTEKQELEEISRTFWEQ